MHMSNINTFLFCFAKTPATTYECVCLCVCTRQGFLFPEPGTNNSLYLQTFGVFTLEKSTPGTLKLLIYYLIFPPLNIPALGGRHACVLAPAVGL